MSYAGFMNQSITLKTRTGLDDYGRETVGSGSAVNARFQQSNKTILMSNGAMAAIDGVIFVPANTSVNTDDRITYSGVDYKVVRKRIRTGRNGTTHHIELDVMLWQT